MTQGPAMPDVPYQPQPMEPVQTEPVQQEMPQVTDTPQPTPEITQEPPAPVISGPSPFTLFGDLVDSVKKALSGPVGIILGLVLLIIIINALVYLIYTRWWLVRNS